MFLLKDANLSAAEAQNEKVDNLLLEASELRNLLEEKRESFENMHSIILNLQAEVDAEYKLEHAIAEEFKRYRIQLAKALNLEKNNKAEREKLLAEMKEKEAVKLAQLRAIEEDVKSSNQAMLEKQNLIPQIQNKIESETRLSQQQTDLLQAVKSMELEYAEKIKNFRAERVKMNEEQKLITAEIEEMRQGCSDAAILLATIQSDCRLKKVERDEILSKINKNEQNYLSEKKKNDKLVCQAESELERIGRGVAHLQTQIAEQQKQIKIAKKAADEFASEIKRDIGDFDSLDDLLLEAVKESNKVDKDLRHKREQCETLKEKKVSKQEELTMLKELEEKKIRRIADKNRAEGLGKRKLPNCALQNEGHVFLIKSTSETPDASISEAWSTSYQLDESYDEQAEANAERIMLYKKFF